MTNKKTKKKLIKIAGVMAGILLLVFLWYFVTALLFYFPVGGNVAPGVTREKILSLKIGMKKDDVINILGSPIDMEQTVSGDYLIYATSGLLGAGFEINLRIIDNILFGIYIEESDLGVYYCDKIKCLGIIQAKRFNKLFPE